MNFKKFNFKDLFVLDLANNHQGSLSHGENIIASCSAIAKKYDLRSVIKFQFRDLPNFIHNDHRSGSGNKHVNRFLSTSLPWSDYKRLADVAKQNGMLTMCTPFDEVSVDKIVEIGFDLIKVASCSAKDWPLLDKIAATSMPIIASTGGLLQSEVDDLVSFFKHRGCDFALMHCVSIYPTPDEACNLGNIAAFRERYPDITIGWSTHEPPKDTLQVALAYALGAEIFERHVGIETEDSKLNAYSSNPNDLENWILSFNRAKLLIGDRLRGAPLAEEYAAINDLRRGIYLAQDVKKGQTLIRDDVFFAFPCIDGQLSAGEWRADGLISTDALVVNAPLMKEQTLASSNPEVQTLKSAIHDVKAMLAIARVPLTHEFVTEYSHHYGISNFRKFGVVLITVINRAYAKKILVQLPGQSHPAHFHKLKEETFLVLWGELISELDGRQKILSPGDTLTVPPGVWHSFKTDTGCVFEEISTTAFKNDSVYRDESINTKSNLERKTEVDHWGRFQLLDI